MDKLFQINPLFALVVAMAVSMAVIPIMWRAAPFVGMMDEPDARKVHRHTIPRIGGTGVVFGTLFPVVLLLNFDPLLQGYLLGALVIFCFGAWDDAREIGHYKKFFGQILAVGLVINYGGLWITQMPFFDIGQFPEWYAKLFTFFAMVGMINAINHSDGLDGLAGGESVLSLLVISFIAYISRDSVTLIIASATLGSVLGFLRFNTYPAKIFMGDAGSQFIGYTLGFLAILLMQSGDTLMSPALTLLFLGLPVVDILVVLLLRVKGGLHWFKASRNHVHHRLLDLGFKHYPTVVIIYSIQALFVSSAIILRNESDLIIMAAYLLFTTTLFALLTNAERIGWHMKPSTLSSLHTTSIFDGTKSASKFRRIPLLIVQAAIPIYVLLGSFWVSNVPSDFAFIAVLLCVLAVVDRSIVKEEQSIFMRLGIYVSVLFIAYLSTVPTDAVPMSVNKYEAIFFTFLAAAVGLAVRYARDIKFKTNPTDYLIVFGVVTIAVLGRDFLEAQEICLLVVKGMVLLYGCELLINRAFERWNMVNFSAVVSLAVLGVRGLL